MSATSRAISSPEDTSAGAGERRDVEGGQVVGLDRPVEIPPVDLDDHLVGQTEVVQDHRPRQSSPSRPGRPASPRRGGGATSTGPAGTDRARRAATSANSRGVHQPHARPRAGRCRAPPRPGRGTRGRGARSRRPGRRPAAARRCARPPGATPAPRRRPARAPRPMPAVTSSSTIAAYTSSNVAADSYRSSKATGRRGARRRRVARRAAGRCARVPPGAPACVGRGGHCRRARGPPP